MIRTLRGSAVALLAVSALAACKLQRYEPGAVSLEPAERAAENAIGTAPMFAISGSGDRALGWVSAPDSGSGGRLYVAVNGHAPVEIRDSLGRAQAPPRLAYGPNGWIYAAYAVGNLVPGARLTRSTLRLTHSRNGGRTWSAPVTMGHEVPSGASSSHALHVADDGTVYLSWVGDPAGVAATKSSGTRATPGPHIRVSEAMPGTETTEMATLQRQPSAAWVATSTNHGDTFSTPVRVDVGAACPCCHAALASGSDGSIYMAWRHVFPGSIRDVVVARSTDKGRTWSRPERVHADDWRVGGCPNATPSIAVDSSGAASVAWWTGKPGAAGVYYARAQKGTTHFAPPVALGIAPYSRPSHVQLGLTPDGDVVVAWDDGTRQVPQVVVRASVDAGRTWGPVSAISPAGQAANFPALAMTGRRFEIAWSQHAPAAASHSNAAPVFVRRGVLQ